MASVRASCLSVSVVMDLYNAGLTADGEPFEAEMYYVQATAPNGRRWMHQEPFYGAVAGTNEFTGEPEFIDVRDQASARAEKLANKIRAHIAAGGLLDGAHWFEKDPVYGSAAYDSLDAAGYFKEKEKQAEAQA